MTNYPPELIEDFEKAFDLPHGLKYLPHDARYVPKAGQQHGVAKRWTNILKGFAQNWHRVREMEKIVEAVAHIGLDFGYGCYELEDRHIEAARKLLEKGNE